MRLASFLKGFNSFLLYGAILVTLIGFSVNIYRYSTTCETLTTREQCEVSIPGRCDWTVNLNNCSLKSYKVKLFRDLWSWLLALVCLLELTKLLWFSVFAYHSRGQVSYTILLCSAQTQQESDEGQVQIDRVFPRLLYVQLCMDIGSCFFAFWWIALCYVPGVLIEPTLEGGGWAVSSFCCHVVRFGVSLVFYFCNIQRQIDRLLRVPRRQETEGQSDLPMELEML